MKATNRPDANRPTTNRRWRLTAASLAAAAVASLAGTAPEAQSHVVSSVPVSGTGGLDTGSLRGMTSGLAGSTGSLDGALPSSRTEQRSTEVARMRREGLPLAWETNKGQWPETVRFGVRARRYTAWTTSDALVMSIPFAADAATDTLKVASVRMVCEGASDAVRAVGGEALPGIANYLIGSDASSWVTSVPTWTTVRNDGVWAGIDMVFGGDGSSIEYAFELAPGADVRDIALRFEGIAGSAIDGTGSLVLDTPAGPVTHRAPIAFQTVRGEKRPVDAAFVRDEKGVVGFAVGRYDATLPLVIDPLIDYSTYHGGSIDIEETYAVDAGNSGEIWFGGFTVSLDYPTTAGVVQTTHAGLRDATVTKLNTTGSTRVYSTYLGGVTADYCEGLDSDLTGVVYVTGRTLSNNFPTTVSGYQASDPNYIDNQLPAGYDPSDTNAEDGYLAVLNKFGTALVYGTYLGDSGGTTGLTQSYDVSADEDGLAVIAGVTAAVNLSTTDATTLNGTSDAFVALFDTTASGGASLLDLSYVGGAGAETAFGVALSADSTIASLCGQTSAGIAEVGSILAGSYAGNLDAFVVQYDLASNAVVYADHLGDAASTDLDTANDIQDHSGVLYIVGSTRSLSWPFTGNAIQGSLGGGDDAFISVIDVAGTTHVFSDIYGGSGFETAKGIAVDLDDNIYVVGTTTTQPTDFNALTLVNAVDSSIEVLGQEAFLLKIDSSMTYEYASYLGGSANEAGEAVAADLSGNAYFVGTTFSNNFPVSGAALDSTLGDGRDGFVVKLATTTMNLVPTLGHFTDAFAVSKDIIKLNGFFSFNALSTNPTFVPATDAITLNIGPNGDLHALSIAAGDPRWLFKSGAWKWKGAFGGATWVLDMNTTTGKFLVSKTKFNFTTSPLPENPIRLTMNLVSGAGNNDGATGRFYYEGSFNTLRNQTVLRYDGK